MVSTIMMCLLLDSGVSFDILTVWAMPACSSNCGLVETLQHVRYRTLLEEAAVTPLVLLPPRLVAVRIVIKMEQMTPLHHGPELVEVIEIQ